MSAVHISKEEGVATLRGATILEWRREKGEPEVRIQETYSPTEEDTHLIVKSQGRQILILLTCGCTEKIQCLVETWQKSHNKPWQLHS